MNEELNWTGREKIYVYLFNSLRYIAANLKTWRNTMDKRIRENTLTVLLVNCHDVTGGIFDRWISRQPGMKRAKAFKMA